MFFLTIFTEPFVWMVRFLMDPGCARCQGSEAKTWWSRLIFGHSFNSHRISCEKILTFLRDEQVKSSHWLLTTAFAMFADSKKTLLKKNSTFTLENSVGSWLLTAKTSLPPIEIFNQNSPRTSSCKSCHLQLMHIFSQGGDPGSITRAIMCHFAEPYFVNLFQNCLCKLPVKF